MSTLRLATGGRIDRSRPLRFSFDGHHYQGFAGDTLASALIANGVHLVGRSFKYHRPRGIVGAGADEPNALVTVARDAARRTPNLRATQIELYDRLAAESQNRWPSLTFDLSAAFGVAAPLLAVGFYYKTFMWPRAAWKRLYEPAIRAMAGLGRAPAWPDPDRYSRRFAHCDVLVLGAGPAGLPRSFSQKFISHIAVGRRMKRSATSAATIENALSQPNSRSDGRSENTVTTRPQASTTVVRISAGPTRTVARSTASAGVTPGFVSSLSRLRK